jgi:hypothetical protein
MPKRSRGVARRRIARTSGQSASALDNEFLHGETDKTSDLALDTVEPGEVMSGNQGVKISDDQNSLKAGLRGPTLMEDFHLREKITHFDHERIPERVVHAYRPSARCCRALCVSADRAARPGLDAAENRGFST